MARVLVVEDEVIIAMMIENWLEDCGHVVVGTATTNTQALVMIEQLRPDYAVIDFVLADGTAHSVVSKLKRMKVPFAIVTGAAIPALDLDVPLLPKPINFAEFEAVLGCW